MEFIEHHDQETQPFKLSFFTRDTGENKNTARHRRKA